MRRPAKRYFVTLGSGAPEELEAEVLDGDRLRVTVRGETLEVDARALGEGGISLLIGAESHDVRIANGGERLTVSVADRSFSVDVADERRMRLRAAGGRSVAHGKQTMVAPMPGKVVRVLVKPGDEVQEGQGLIVVEAMKMENELRSPKNGSILEVSVVEGATVEGGATLVVIG